MTCESHFTFLALGFPVGLISCLVRSLHRTLGFLGLQEDGARASQQPLHLQIYPPPPPPFHKRGSTVFGFRERIFFLLLRKYP